MAERPWRVAIIDSGLDPRAGIVALDSCRLTDESQRIVESPLTTDATGHGTAIAQILANPIPEEPVAAREFLVAQVLDDQSTTTPAAVAAALRWSLKRGAQLIQLSLGLAQDRSILAEAVAEAIDANVIVVASTPARGIVSFPACYRGVIRGTGDARCGMTEISVLHAPDRLFGACAAFASSVSGPRRGSSIGAAFLSRFITMRLPAGASALEISERLEAIAAYRGREHRVAAGELGQ